MLTTKWKSGGKERSWTSTRGEHDPDETIAQLAARHEAELAELLEAFPEDPKPAGQVQQLDREEK